jgi:hypothetical protein
MARPEEHLPITLDDAVEQLKRNPSRPVRANVEGLEVELRVVAARSTESRIGTRLAAIGPWEGVELADLAKLLADARAAGGTASVPELP